MCVPSLRDFRLFLTTGDCRPRLQIVTSLRDCTTAPALSLFSSRCNSFATLIKASRCQRRSANFHNGFGAPLRPFVPARQPIESVTENVCRNLRLSGSPTTAVNEPQSRRDGITCSRGRKSPVNGEKNPKSRRDGTPNRPDIQICASSTEF